MLLAFFFAYGKQIADMVTGWEGMSLQPAAGTKQALRRGVGSKVVCDYALGYLKTGLLLASWPTAGSKALAGWVGEAGVLCSEEEGARRLHVTVFK